MSYDANRRNTRQYEDEEDTATIPSLASTVISEDAMHQLSCPEGFDEATFRALPVELQREILEQQQREILEQQQEQQRRPRRIVKDDNYYREQAVACGIDVGFLMGLPADLRDDVIQEHQQSQPTSASPATPAEPRTAAHLSGSVEAAYGYDPDVLAALPADIKAEVLAQRRQHHSQRSSTVADAPRPTIPHNISTRTAMSTGSAGTARSATSTFSQDSRRTTTPSNAAEYSGSYDDRGLRQGRGTLSFQNGDVYRGDFFRDLRHGKGEITFADGSSYKGGWEQDKFHGYGVRRFVNGDMFIGNYQNGQRNGHGKFEYSKGDTYVGEWVNGRMDGYGTYYHKNGDAYEGLFDNGKKHGPGKYSLNDGRLDISRYENGQRSGIGVRLSAERKRAWRLVDGRVDEEISMDKAYSIQENVGFQTD